jgi:ABC-2 type transport system ATP-binding protein
VTTTATAPAIEVRSLEKSYGARAVLRGVDLEVARGEVFCLLGPNGAGKTTTVEILEGYRTASAGHVRVLGMDPIGQPQALRERIGVVLQECGFPAYLKVGELLESYRRYFPRPRPCEELLELVELRDEVRTVVRRLSGGQRRRLDLALALVGDPDLVFLDEPTTGFDPEARQRCWQAISNLRATGATVLLTTHYLDEAQQLADRVAILVDGHIAGCGTPPELARRSGAPTRISFTAPRADGHDPELERLGVHLRGTRASLSTTDPWEALRLLLDWAGRRDTARLDDLAVLPPTLDDVYLHLVGNGERR